MTKVIISDDEREEQEILEYFAYRPPSSGVPQTAYSQPPPREQAERIYARYEEMMAIADEAAIVQDVHVDVQEVPDGGLSFRLTFRHRGTDCVLCACHPGADSDEQRSVEPDSADGASSDCGSPGNLHAEQHPTADLNAHA